MLTRLLVAALAILAAAGTWRLARWYWRPRLRLPAAPRLQHAEGGIRLLLDVRNAGAGKSRGCRARLLRLERQRGESWVKADAVRVGGDGGFAPEPAVVRAHSKAILAVERLLPDEPGRYRVELAVIDGEEVRASYVIDVEERAPGNVP